MNNEVQNNQPQGERPVPNQGQPMPVQGGNQVPPQGVQQVPKKSIKDLFNLKDKRNIILLIPCILIVIILVILLINLIATKTLKCKSETEISDIQMVTTEKITFKFGKPHSEYNKVVMNFADTDYDKDAIKERVKAMKKQAKETCKKSDGCRYSIKQSGKKITVIEKQKFDKDYKEDFADRYDSFKEYKDLFNDLCDD